MFFNFNLEQNHGCFTRDKIDQFYVESVSVEYFKPAILQQTLKYSVYSSSLQECCAAGREIEDLPQTKTEFCV